MTITNAADAVTARNIAVTADGTWTFNQRNSTVAPTTNNQIKATSASSAPGVVTTFTVQRR